MSADDVRRVREAGRTALRWYRISLAFNAFLLGLVVLLVVSR